MRLPPVTFTEAANTALKIRESNGDVLALIGGDEALVHLAACLLMYDTKLKQAMDALIAAEADKTEMKLSIDELTTIVNSYLTQAGLEPADPAQLEEIAQAGERKRLAEQAEITGVHWQGRTNGPGGYFENFEAINRDLAKGISEMARQRFERVECDENGVPIPKDAIETTATEAE